MEEAWQDLLAVLRRQHLRELDDAREAQTPVAERLDDLREALDELRRK
jgi:hypothetical protein